MADIGSAFMGPLLANQQFLASQQEMGLRQQQFAQNQKLMPAELAQRLASTRLTTAEAGKMEAEIAGEKKAAELMAQGLGSGVPGSGAEGGGQSLSSMLLRNANIYAQAGLSQKAEAALAKASEIQARETTARNAQARTAIAQDAQRGKEAAEMVKFLGGVNGQVGWDNANETFEKTMGHPSPFAGMPYDPQLVKMLQDSATTSYQRSLIGIRERALGLQTANVKSEIAHRGAEEGIANARLGLAREREKRIAKTEGKDAGVPGKIEINAADNLLSDR